MPNDLSQPIAIVDAKAAKQQNSKPRSSPWSKPTNPVRLPRRGLLARRQARDAGIAAPHLRGHLDGVPVSAVPSACRVMPQPTSCRRTPTDDGARMADDYFCQGCGARGVFGFCAECR
jgi:hypothetical protein